MIILFESYLNMSKRSRINKLLHKNKFHNLYFLNMFQNSTLFGTIYFLVKTAPKVRGC